MDGAGGRDAAPVLKVGAAIQGLDALAQLDATERARLGRHIKAAVNETADQLQARLRVDTTTVLGPRVANAWRREVYPPARPSVRAAGLVYTKAPNIIDAFNKGVPIRAKEGGDWLAIPLPAAGVGPKGKRMTPELFQQSRGLKLRMVYLKGRSRALLVAENARLNSRSLAQPNTGSRGGARFTRLAGRTSVPVFLLVRQARPGKRLDLDRRVDEASRDLRARLQSRIGDP